MDSSGSTSSGWRAAHRRLDELLQGLSFRDRAGAELGQDEGFARWCAATEQLRRAAGTIYLVGNGASASMASHFSADLAKNAQLHTEVFSDLALITAIANDLGYDRVFAEPLLRRARPGDVLVAISSSGASPNVLGAARVARDHGMSLFTLSAMAPTNPLRAVGDLNAYVAATTYGEAETCHAAILHHWMDLVARD
jgi:D-sedoheptulose 7-phosphate isomerase